jgi:hypothetical protein
MSISCIYIYVHALNIDLKSHDHYYIKTRFRFQFEIKESEIRSLNQIHESILHVFESNLVIPCFNFYYLALPKN